MKKMVLLWICVGYCFLADAQYSVSQDVDRQFYCNTSSVMKETGKVQSFTATSFNGFKYHFYYYSSGVYSEIGNFTASVSGGSIFTSYSNLIPGYFEGSQIGNATKTFQTSSQLWLSIDIPYATFPNNNTGQQLAVDVEAIDQFGSTTTHSGKTLFSVPLLYTNPVTLSAPAITSNSSMVCSGVDAQLSSAPNYAGYGFTYDWYKDGAAISLGDYTGTISVAAQGNYYAVISDACQTITSTSITINSGTLPEKATISLPALPLCNGASGTLTANGSGGTYTWSTGSVSSALSVSTAGNYSVHESNSCGAGPESDVAVVTTAVTPPAPTVTSSNGTLLCNGGSTTLSASPSEGGSIRWNTGATGNTISMSAAGNYYAYESNGCGSGSNSSTVSISTNSTPPAPTLSISGGMTLCNGLNQTISTSPSTVGGVIRWSNGATGNSITINSNGNYYAWETNGCGNSANSASLVVTTLNTPPAPSVTPAGSLALCGGAFTILASSGTVTGNILWYFNGASTGHFGTTYTVSSAGNYTTREQSGCGTSASSNSVSILTNNIPAAPSLNVSGTILLCDGAAQTISGSPATSGGVLHWSTGATGNSITVSASGNYYAWETNATCGAGPNSGTVTINTLNKPPAPVVNPPGNQLLCNGATATLSSSGTNITWSNGTVGNTLVTGVAGNYYAIDNNACGNRGASNTVVITTGNCPFPSPGTSFFICPGKTKLIDAGAGYDSYLWNTGATTQTITVGPGSYYVTVMKSGCYATSATVTVSNYAVGAALISASGTLNFCAGGSVTLASSVGSSYLWSNGATTNSIVVNASGTYSVTVTDGNGCQASSASVSAIVNPLPNAVIAGSNTICANAAAPVVTFTGSGGTAPYTFIYKLNGSANQSITTTSGNNISISVPTTAAGIFSYTLVGVSESSGTTCSNSASGNATVVVNPLPTALLSGSTSICQFGSAPSITFAGSGATPPYTFTYTINGGANKTITTISGSSVSVSVPTSVAGLFTYSLVRVSESSGTSCTNAASGSASVLVNPLPTATIAGNNSVCQNSASPQIIFTGSAGIQPYTFSYKINGSAVQTVSTTGNSVAINVPTNSAETYIYSLIGVQESSGTSCSNSASGNAMVVVNPLPTAAIAGSTSICQNSSAPSITFTGSGATAPYTFTYKINGGVNQSVTSITGSSVTVSVPTLSPGTYVYSLVSVQESGTNSCTNAAAGSATVVVNPSPSASIAGSTTICQNSTAPSIVFTGSGATAPYTFVYKINNGANQTVSTVSGNNVSVSVPANSAGMFTYTLVGVSESSGTACLVGASGSSTVAINAMPLAAISGSVTVCQDGSAPSVIFTGIGATSPYTFVYKINSGPNQTLSTTFGNSVAVSVPTTTPGTYVYNLVSVQESSGTTCINAASGAATVVVNPVPSAIIAGTTTVCQNSDSPSIRFTGSGATPPYTFTFKINGGPNQTVTTVSGNSVSISAPTNLSGNFVYSLLSVQESSGVSCGNAAGGSVTVTVNPLPSAVVGGTMVVCQNSPSPFITFTGSGATAPYTFTYQINGGANKTVTTSSGNTVKVSVPTDVAGTFTYSLINVMDSGGTRCINTVFGSSTVTVNPQPVKALIAAPNTHLCNGDTGVITVTNFQSGFTYTWYKDSVLFRSTTLDTIHVTQAATYTVMAGSDKGCNAVSISDPIIISTGIVSKPVITGSLKVCPDGRTKLAVVPKDSLLLYSIWRWTDPPGHVLARDSIFSAFAGQYQIYTQREGCADSALVAITSDDTDFPAGKLNIKPGSIPYGGRVTLIADVTNAVQYQWDIGTGSIINTASNKIIQNYYSASDSLHISVKAISERNCKTTFNGYISVDPRIIDSIPDHSFTGNLKDWNVFPVPFHNELKVSVILRRNETVRMDLFTVDGRWVRSWQYSGKKGENVFQLNHLENLPANVFYLITGFYNNQKHFEKLFK